MNAIVPWVALCAVVQLHCPKGVGGRPPIGLERMRRIHFIQHGFNSADEACEEGLYVSASLRRFVGIDLGSEPVPDTTTVLKLRRLLSESKPGKSHRCTESRGFRRVGRH
jgi:transposase, IS5 family